MQHLTLTLSVTCNHCAQPVPVNGPLRSVHCSNCGEDTPIPRLPDALEHAAAGWRILGSPYQYTQYETPAVSCYDCEAVTSLESTWQQPAPVKIACAACGAAAMSVPAPDWLREELPGAAQVFAGEIDGVHGGERALPVPRTEPQPIAMSCPACAGGLMFKHSDTRTVNCRYCGVSVFIPDELWRRLHPAKKMARWLLTYEDSLKTRATLEREAEKERERAARRKREEEEQVRKEQQRLEQEAQARARVAEAVRAYRRRLLVYVTVMLASLIVWYFLWIR